MPLVALSPAPPTASGWAHAWPRPPWYREPSASWDRREWLVLPTDSAIERCDLSPCGGCGHPTLDLVIRRDETPSEAGGPPRVDYRCLAQCMACCYPRGRPPRNLSIVGSLDVRTQTWTLFPPEDRR